MYWLFHTTTLVDFHLFFFFKTCCLSPLYTQLAWLPFSPCIKRLLIPKRNRIDTCLCILKSVLTPKMTIFFITWFLVGRVWKIADWILYTLSKKFIQLNVIFLFYLVLEHGCNTHFVYIIFVFSFFLFKRVSNDSFFFLLLLLHLQRTSRWYIDKREWYNGWIKNYSAAKCWDGPFGKYDFLCY